MVLHVHRAPPGLIKAVLVMERVQPAVAVSIVHRAQQVVQTSQRVVMVQVPVVRVRIRVPRVHIAQVEQVLAQM